MTRTFIETHSEILLALLQDTTIIILAKIGKFWNKIENTQ